MRFETPDQEVRKFVRRLTGLGVDGWPRDAAALELFCGRGNGLRALSQLGFERVFGVDLSVTLVARSAGRGRCGVGDCRRLPFAEGSCDVAIVQGGFHHLPELMEDLEATIREVRRVLRDGGRLVAVEPWRTPFLSFVHGLAALPSLRRLSPRLDALGTMIELEGRTYQDWLAQPAWILGLLRSSFEVEVCRARWGKLHFVGRKS